MSLVTEKDLLWVAWSPSAALVYRQAQAKTPAQLLEHSFDADWRYFLKLFHWSDKTLLLRAGDRFRTSLFEAKGGEPFQPVRDWPQELASLPPNEVIPGRDGEVAGIGQSGHLTIWRRGKSLNVYALPDEFTVTDLDWDRQKRLWICGTAPTNRLKSLKYRRALAVSNDGGASWVLSEVVHGGFKVAWRSLLSGAEETYRKIKIVNDYIVLSAETDDLEHASTFLFVKDRHGEWQSGTLDGDVLNTVVPARNGGVEIISHYGQSVLIRPGETWRYHSLAPRIQKLIQGINLPARDQPRFEILDAQASGGELVLVVSVRLAKENHLLRAGEAVVVMSEDCDRLITFHDSNDPEIIAACYLQ